MGSGADPIDPVSPSGPGRGDPGGCGQPRPGGAWWRLELPLPLELEESLLWKLPQLGIPRVAVRHAPERPEERLLQAWLPEADWPADQRRELERALAPLGEPFAIALPAMAWERQDDEDWSLSWKRHWMPDPVGKRLLILPAWLDCPSEHAGRMVIAMDPGSAFGTGSHPTTRLCLEAMEEMAAADPGLAGLRVADLGCGSGILGMAALRFGAASVAAVDSDGLAVRASIDNAALNALGPAFAVGLGSVERLAELLDGQPADLLLCNILAPVITALCPAFATVLAASGIGLLSGLLVEQAPALERALAAEGWTAELIGRQERWGLMRIRSQAVVS
ncbi:MAG: 50S ribosomal protein L11 methyltransferase [Cyanobium sp.]